MRLALSKKYETMQLRLQKCMASHVFKEPKRIIENRYIIIDNYIKRLEAKIQNKTQEEKQKYVALLAKLDTLSPLKTLTRGYAIIEQEDKIIKSVKQLKKDDEINLKFVDGSKKARIQ